MTINTDIHDQLMLYYLSKHEDGERRSLKEVVAREAEAEGNSLKGIFIEAEKTYKLPDFRLLELYGIGILGTPIANYIGHSIDIKVREQVEKELLSQLEESCVASFNSVVQSQDIVMPENIRAMFMDESSLLATPLLDALEKEMNRIWSVGESEPPMNREQRRGHKRKKTNKYVGEVCPKNPFKNKKGSWK